MKHVKHFSEFLANHVNLNQSRLNILEERVENVKNFLKKELKGYRTHSPQGSYAHQTIIKPVKENDEFDADILVLIKDDDFDPEKFTNYVGRVHSTLKESSTYENIVKKETRCVKIDYSGDFHLDVVPCVEHNDDHYICNRKDEKHEKTDGDGYRKWLIDKNGVIGGNNFRKTTRLLKFLRDHKRNFSVKSILLTTMLGNVVAEVDKDSEEFSDLPTTLKTLSNRLNDFLQDHPTMPTITNPVLPEENFNRHWDQNKYENFRIKFNAYNAKLNEAFDEGDSDKSVKKWRELFGKDFGELKEGKASAAVIGGGVVTGIPTPVVPATKPYAYNDND